MKRIQRKIFPKEIFKKGHLETDQMHAEGRMHVIFQWIFQVSLDSGIPVLDTSNLGAQIREACEKKFCESKHRYLM